MHISQYARIRTIIKTLIQTMQYMQNKTNLFRGYEHLTVNMQAPPANADAALLPSRLQLLLPPTDCQTQACGRGRESKLTVTMLGFES